MGWLEGSAVLVTGGASGLGRAIVERFVDEGARVVVFDRSKDKLDGIAADLKGAVRTVSGDVTSFADNVRACTVAEEEFGGLDTFVGNAGLWDFNRSLLDTPADALADGFDELFAVNVKGYLLGAKAAAPLLRRASGSIVFTLSNAAFYPGGGGPMYTAAKHAALGLVRQLAYELAPYTRVNAVAPGGLATDLRGPDAMGLADRSLTQELPINQILTEHSALRRAVRPQDAVGPYVLLASRESVITTGTVIDISTFGIPQRRPPAD
ncbi:3-(cis-5,6-dihydroxycyclohexa-1,3-dien-1-yl)propanoate dehydrogenase [Streptomyces vastus]|uniref:3-phenylpropionate-dihydrodiol/cinnamic acid-dihydrodiol dehydrogenase n=1 Tax=Streptomyces vastus TaxID=285451 RepID=A0ABP6DIQ7_9ACTN